MANKARLQLRELGSKLATPPPSKDALVKLLKQAATSLSELDQFPLPSMLESMQPFLNAIANEKLLKHQDRDVKVLVATCICEITRITAPEAPYSDDVLKDIFHLIVGTLSGLGDVDSPSFGRRVVILETLARYRSCIVMLDLECHDLINEMFGTLFAVVSDGHPKNVRTAMQTIMVLILDESEDIQEDLLSTILSVLGRRRNDISKAARKLAMDVIEHCAGKLEPCIKQFLVSSLSGDSSSQNNPPDYHEVMYDLYLCAPQILAGIIPYITGELLADQLDSRLKAVHLLGDLFALSGLCIPESLQPLFTEFVKRLTDRALEVRISVIDQLKNCLMSNPCRPEASLIIQALCDRLLDYDETVRKQVVAAVLDVACHSPEAINSGTVMLVAERLRDKSLSVKRYTMERLADLYRRYCLTSSDGSVSTEEFEWIPGKILRCLYDKDFRSETIELTLCGSLFPPEFPVKDKVTHWVTVFSGFDKVEVKALEQILVQKQRLQQEMLKFLSLRQSDQEVSPDLPKKISGCVWVMSRLLSNPALAEESFLMLNQLKDVNIWRLLANLLDPSASFSQARSSRDDLLKILGEKHPLYDFMGMLSVKCSYLLFNKDFVREILSKVAAEKPAGTTKLTTYCMNLLTIISSFSPLLFSGSEEDLVLLLKEDSEVIKEGIAHVLAKAGGTIREQLAVTPSSVDLLLERLCLEGSRKQAKYSVQALAAITDDEGLKTLSILYTKLLKMLMEKAHLPAVLQSLGCVAEIAMSVFATKETEVVELIRSKILEDSNPIANGNSMHHIESNDMTELCLLKIYSIKTLVKSFLPIRDSHLRPERPEIEKLVQMLRDILTYGDVSKDLKSSVVDKAQMRLAAAKAILRLSRQWDHKIPIDVVYTTLRMSQDTCPQSRKLFVSKVYQYIKERLLDVKYTCAFLFHINDSHSPEYQEAKHILLEVAQVCQQGKVRQFPAQSNMSSQLSYQEYILAYLVHALAHDPLCPNIEECAELQAFEPIYWRLHLFLDILLHGDEGCQTGDSKTLDKKKESFSAVMSTFHSIKCSVDAVDVKKSKTTHAICDLGQSIAKRIVQDQANNVGLNAVQLPSILYKSAEEIENGSSTDEQTWLGSDSALTHFEALKDGGHKQTASEATKGELPVEESDGDGNEMPLRTMMKMLSKKKKLGKNQIVSSHIKHRESDVDVLEIVRDINLEKDQGLEVGSLSLDPKHFGSGEMARENKVEKDLASQKRKRSNTTNTLDASSPKRKRSMVQRSHSTSRKGKKEAPHGFWGEKSHVEKATLDTSNSDLLVSCLPTIKSISSRFRKKDADEYIVEEAACNDEKEPAIPVGSNKKDSSSRSLKGSSRKRKLKSILGLAKCSSNNSNLSGLELVGSRIKVWWPMDKEFYEGVVQSYNPGDKKHKILYDDGEVEVLLLSKEQWELVNNGNVPIKKLKSQHQSQDKDKESLRRLQEKTNKGKAHAGSRQGKNSLKKVRKAASKLHIVDNKRETGADFSEAESKGGSDISNAQPRSCSEVDDANSDKHEEKGEANMVNKLEEAMTEEKSYASSPDGSDMAESDDEPLIVWKLRAGKAT